MKKTVKIGTIEQTEKLARAMGALLKGGECIEFVSDLGGGKTTFIRGLVAGTGSRDNVSSPTFTISKQYKSDNLRFYHFDLYRLQEPGLISEDIAEALEDDIAVVLIEWGQTVRDVLPDERIVIEISKSADNLEGRIFEFTIPEGFSYIEGATK